MRVNPLVLAAALAIPTGAAAHVTVWPKEAPAGAHQKYDLRVPNEKKVDTIAVEVRFPPGLKVVAFEQKPGWMTEPVRDAKGAFTSARWTGHLAPQQFVEFGVLAVNPPSATDLSWTAIQSFADGTQIEWSGTPGSKTPAPRVTVR